MIRTIANCAVVSAMIFGFLVLYTAILCGPASISLASAEHNLAMIAIGAALGIVGVRAAPRRVGDMLIGSQKKSRKPKLIGKSR